MSIVSSQTIDNDAPNNGFRLVRHRYTDHTGGTSDIFKRVPDAWTSIELDAQRSGLESQVLSTLEQTEIDEAVIAIESDQSYDNTSPQHLTQPDFDRRVLMSMMLIVDVHHFRNALNFWLSVETRGGANANQRSEYLFGAGQRATYDLIANRFGDAQGALTYLDDEKGQVWTEFPEGLY